MKKNILPLVLAALMFAILACASPVSETPAPVAQATEIFPVVLPTSPEPIEQLITPAPLSIEEYFPLTQGAYWVYQGKVKYTQPNSSEVIEQDITWRMEVTHVYQQGEIAGFELHGAPWDLTGYEEGRQPSDYGIIRAGGNFYHTYPDTVRRMSDNTDTLEDLVNEYDLFLDIPLISGKKFCDTESITRVDGMYCWTVGEATPVDANTIQGLDPSQSWMAHPIHKGTLPDFSTMEFIPGIGISSYTYHHNGSVSDVDLRLIEYHPGD